MKFTVIGTPQPQGSARAFMPKGWTRPVITSANAKLKPWRQEVSQVVAATMAEQGIEIIRRPAAVRVEAIFFFQRPKSVKKAALKTTAPDADKLARSLGDSMSRLAYEDDAQIVDFHVLKEFGEPARVEVEVLMVPAK
jgi:Holliday junction resolvase RusA-like endonuclease